MLCQIDHPRPWNKRYWSLYNRHHCTKYIVVFVSLALYNTLFILLVPTPQVLIRDHVSPYNGTNFTLTGVVRLSVYVDTPVTVLGVWWSGDNPQETTIQPYPTDLPFQPLATDSSGEYTLTVTVHPSDNLEYILSRNGSVAYNLVVTREFLHIHHQSSIVSYTSPNTIIISSQLFLLSLLPSLWHHMALPLMSGVERPQSSTAQLI